jgi:hypothetical protein
MTREAGFSPHVKCYKVTLNILRNFLRAQMCMLEKRGGLRGISPLAAKSGFLAAFFGFYLTSLFAFSGKHQTVFLIDIFEVHYG